MTDNNKKFLSLKYIGAELGELMELKALVRQRIRFLDENKDKISPAVYGRLIAEYNSYLGGLDCELTVGLSDYEVRLAEIRVFANQLETLKKSFADSLQEIKLRYAIGEFDKETFEQKSADHEKRLKAFEQGILKYSGQQKKISRFLEKVYETGAISPDDIVETLEGFDDTAVVEADIPAVQTEPANVSIDLEPMQAEEAVESAGVSEEAVPDLDESPINVAPDIQPERKFSIVEEEKAPEQVQVEEPLESLSNDEETVAEPVESLNEHEEKAEEINESVDNDDVQAEELSESLDSEEAGIGDINELSETEVAQNEPGFSNSLLDGLETEEETPAMEKTTTDEARPDAEDEMAEIESLDRDLLAGSLSDDKQEVAKPEEPVAELESEIVGEINPEEVHPFEEDKIAVENTTDGGSQSVDLDELMGIASVDEEPSEAVDNSPADDILSGAGSNSDSSQSIDSLMGFGSSESVEPESDSDEGHSDNLIGAHTPEKEEQGSDETSGGLTDFLDMNIAPQAEIPKQEEKQSPVEQIQEAEIDVAIDQGVDKVQEQSAVLDREGDKLTESEPDEVYSAEEQLDEQIIVQQFEESEEVQEPEMNLPSIAEQPFDGGITEDTTRDSVNGSGSRGNIISIEDEISIEADPSRQEDDGQLLSINQTLDAIKKKTVKCKSCGTLNYAIRWYCENCEEPLTSL